MLSLFLARHRDRWVAGIIILWFNRTAYYKFGASDDGFLQLRANQLLMWEAIQQASANGCTIFDFGRTSATNRGLLQYKRRWATIERSLNYIRFPEVQTSGILDETSKKHKLFGMILTRVPTKLIRMSGQLLYKHFG